MVQPKRRYTTTPGTSRREYSRVFYLNNKGVSVRVCKLLILRKYAISNGWLDRALKAQVKESGLAHMDERGKHAPGNKTEEAVVEQVKRHVDSFPKYRSHYSRHDNPNCQYLSPELSVAKMYSMYKAECEESGDKYVSEWVYRKIFNEFFNLAFGM